MEQVCSLWKLNILLKLMRQFDPKNIFNAYETGLLFKCLPNRTLSFKPEQFSGENETEDINKDESEGVPEKLTKKI